MPGETVVWLGLAIGLLFGAVGQYSGFCLQSGLRGWWGEGDPRKVRTFALAAAIALVASQALDAAGLVPLERSIYPLATFSIPVILVGGALFGYGMVLANGCGARALVLLGSGNLRSLYVLLILGVSAQATLTGLLAPTRVSVAGSTGSTFAATTLPGVVGDALGPDLARWLAVAVIGGALLAFAFANRAFRASPSQIAAGLVVGLLVAAGWYVTGHVGADDFDPRPVASLTFIAPIAAGIQYVMLSTGIALGFGVAVVGGVIAGSALMAIPRRQFRLAGFSGPGLMLRYAAGAVLMGVGGALALGCSIGQGLTGFSTLALASLVAVAGILIGSALGIRGPVSVAVPSQ
ncbi:MAG: YeeE/YedE family protein [Bauldia sp.]|nr:YeeE/YedE family protein [Bauldia sp.]